MMKKEAAYQNLIQGIMLYRLRLTALTGACLFLLGSVMLDYWLERESFKILLQIRICSSLALLTLAGITFLKSARSIAIWLTDSIVIISAASISLMIGVTDQVYSNYYQGLFIVLCAMFVVNSFSIKHSIFAGGILMGCYYFGASPSNEAEVALLIANYFFLSSVFVMVLLITVMLSRQHRQEYEQNLRIIESEKLKSQFFANVSHELRTPLTLILSPLEALKQGKYGPLPETLQEPMEMMLNNAVRLLQMVTGILDFSKLESQKTEVRREVTDPARLTQSILFDFDSLITQKKLRKHFDAGNTQNLKVRIDRYLYERILFNLLSNAVKFTPEGGEIKLALAQEGDLLKVAVTDTGIGIPKSEIPNLFKKFHQVEGSSTRRFEGTGLGLAMVKEFSELLGGGVTVESEPSKGTTFTVTLKAPSDSAQEIAAPESRSTRNLNYSHGLRTAQPPKKTDDSLLPLVLVAEDNQELNQYIVSLIRPFCRTRSVYNGLEALETAYSHLPDLILSDVMMPEKDGFAVCEELKQDPRTASIPIVLLTALTHREALMRGWKAGADEYLFKPFHPEELTARIKILLSYVRERKRHQSLQMEVDLAMENALEGAGRFDEKGLAVRVNRTFCEILGGTQPEFAGKSWLSLAHPSDSGKAEAAFQLMQKTGKAEVDLRAQRRNGNVFNARLVLVKADPGARKFSGHYVFIKDISEKQYEKALEIKSELVSMISHELRTPLHALRESIRMISRGYAGDMTPQQKDLLDISAQSIERLVRLVSGIMDFQKHEAGTASFHFEMISLNDLIREVEQQTRAVYSMKPVQILLELEENLPRTAADKDRIFLVISNLLDNAVKFTPKGKIVIRSKHLNKKVRVEVEDSGIGIESRDYSKLFQNFSQLEAGKMQAPFQGAGLGLALARKIIEGHGGILQVESVFGKGSLFYFEIPVTFNAEVLPEKDPWQKKS